MIDANHFLPPARVIITLIHTTIYINTSNHSISIEMAYFVTIDILEENLVNIT